MSGGTFAASRQEMVALNVASDGRRLCAVQWHRERVHRPGELMGERVDRELRRLIPRRSPPCPQFDSLREAVMIEDGASTTN